ncbi:hypothetical protein A4A49_60732 [Nicotiana attenuata]|uniref:Uncharacterized protein n=1 Tax=Nicotiana attenuata TaxID=49451 RepID=A0A1J6I895_NICAT|nr:hypothetical protein A4A49_60732 [Nicotiana attenuata]
MQATQVCYVPYPNKRKDKEDWVAVLNVEPRHVVELPDEEVMAVSDANLPFQVEEVEDHVIDMNIVVEENILLHDPNGDLIKMDEHVDDELLLDHHKTEEEEEEEYETEDTKDDEEDFVEEIDSD